jgi:thymidylate synthase
MSVDWEPDFEFHEQDLRKSLDDALAPYMQTNLIKKAKTNALGLDMDECKKWSRRVLDDYVTSLHNTPLTVDQACELHALKRRIYNKESAKRSRQQKQRYIDQLELRIQELEQENAELRSIVYLHKQ